MILKPQNISELSDTLASANAKNEKFSAVDLSNLARLLEHKSEDMTATVEAGITLAAFQNEIGKSGQWLPIDPPNPQNLTIAELIAKNESGPRRFGYGTIRDFLIGLKVVLADGRVISSGGKVVKNVAGYDVMKLFVGARGTLGVIVEATFKLRPLPETEQFVCKKCKSLDEAEAAVEAVLNSPLTPIVLDLHNVSLAGDQTSVVLGFDGTKEELDWQIKIAAELGFAKQTSLSYDKEFRAGQISLQKISVLPSKTVSIVRSLNNAPFLARAGNGIIYYQGRDVSTKQELPTKLMQRLKNEFDPKHILPELPL